MVPLLLLFLVGFASAANTTTFLCPAGNDCSGMCEAITAANTSTYGNLSALALPCPLGFLCLVNQEPVRCPREYYCPSATSKNKCPSGHYCIKGVSSPKACPVGAVCPEGSWKYVFVLGIIIVLVTHGFIFLLYLAISRGSNRLRREIELSDITNAIEPPKIPLNFSFQNLQVKIKLGNFISKMWGPEKIILQSVSGKFECGKLAAVMGPSGAGKSTFVNVLLGKVSKSGGTILVNGIESSGLNIRTAIGYVPQEDVMLRQGVTVRDILLHSATTRLPSSWTKREIKAKVEDVMRVLKLDPIQNNFIGDEITRGISGGERKRVNIGIELVADPTALVCDEPTSGLDATVAYDVMYFLKQVAKECNMTVIVVLHQPRTEIFELCDDLLLLGKGGYTTYIGPASAAKDYFGFLGNKRRIDIKRYPCPQHVNPADHFIDVVSGKVDSGDHASPGLQYLVDSWQRNKGNYTSDKAQEMAVPKPVSASRTRQFAAYTRRAFLHLFRDVSGRLVDNFLHLLAGAIIALGFVSQEMFIPPIPRQYLPFCPPSISLAFCWYPEVSVIGRLPVYTTIAVGLAAATIGTRTFFNERVVYWRETASGTNTFIYFLAKNLVDLFAIFFYALTFTCAFMVVASPWGSFGGYFIAIILYEYCLFPVGYICGFLTDSNPSVMAVIVALLSGLGTQTSVPFMWSRWFAEILVNNELDYDNQPAEIQPLVKDYTETTFKYKINTYAQCILALILIGLGLRLLAYLLLRFTRRDKQR